jgi:DNA-binding CsgD family transcriptional regulator
MLLVLLMDEAADSTAPSKGGRHSTLTPEIQEKLLAYVRKGLTYDRAGEALGISPATIQNWQARNKQFNNALKKARRDLEASLLDSINLAGEKSWQARAWMAERIFQYAQPSARLQVSQDVTHGISGNLAQLLAGIAGKKKAQVIECKDVTPKTLHTIRNNSYCATDDTQTIVTTTPKILGKTRHRRMKTRKPRKESLAKYTTTPPATPPAPI